MRVDHVQSACTEALECEHTGAFGIVDKPIICLGDRGLRVCGPGGACAHGHVSERSQPVSGGSDGRCQAATRLVQALPHVRVSTPIGLSFSLSRGRFRLRSAAGEAANA
jgi:hypothetical protein